MSRLLNLKFITLCLFIITFGFTLYSKLSHPPANLEVPAGIDEKFDKNTLVINSCEDLTAMISKKFIQSGYDTAYTVKFIDNFIRNRFYHSYSELRMQDNWIASLCGKLIWSDFLCPVRPCDIIKYPMGACSQQGILFQEQLHLLKIPCSTMNFFSLSGKTSGHYAVSVYYDEKWHFYDTNQEPVIIDSTMPSVDEIIDKKLYEKMYVKKSNIRFQEFFKDKSYERVNKEPFSKGKMFYFQMITDFLSDWIWLLFLTLFLVFQFVLKKK